MSSILEKVEYVLRNTPSTRDDFYALSVIIWHNEMAEHEDNDMIARIMRQRYSEGGRVANETPPEADFAPNEFDDLALRDDLEFSETGANSGDEQGDAREDHDRADIVSRVMASRRKKDKLPNPR